MHIEVDEYKKKVKDYDPRNSEEFHSESGKLADADFKKCLKSKQYKRVIFMAGGTASGKTEYAYSYLKHKDQLIYDGTLKNFTGFTTKLQKVKKYSKTSKVKVVFIIPGDWVKSFEVFSKRERKMKPNVFFETHIKSLFSISRILNETKYRVEIYISSVEDGKDKLAYKRIVFKKIGTRSSVAKIMIKLSEKLQDIAFGNGFEIGP
jgi:hypothetical protein